MRAEGTPPAATLTLADQVSKLYELVAGYHATNLLEIARELGVGGADAEPGLTSEALAERLGTHLFYTDVLCRTAFAFGLLDREGAGWRMAPHFDQILGDPESSFYLARTQGAHGGWRRLSRVRAPLPRWDNQALPGTWRGVHARGRRGAQDAPAHLPRLRATATTWSQRRLGKTAGYWTWAAAVAGQSCRSLSGSPRATV